MEIAVVGTGYVGLVTGICLAKMGHNVTCIDVDEDKINKLKLGISPIYEPGLEELMKQALCNTQLHFTTSHKEGFANKEVIFIAVGTPQKPDGSADLRFITQCAKDIAKNIKNDMIVVTKSTVPVGTNKVIKEIISKNLEYPVAADVISNPEFLREGAAVKDFFYGDRIVIGFENAQSANILEQIYQPLNIPIFKTDITSAEMIKYASNAFLATKISFINEVANLCDKFGANITDVATGMGQDKRIGLEFLRAGLGYGGSCFPKDTKAFVKMAEDQHFNFKILKSVIEVNESQQTLLVKKITERFNSLAGKRLALLGLTFKPYTDDIRGAPSIEISRQLMNNGAAIVAYDPAGIEKAKPLLPRKIKYARTLEEALFESDLALILTEWREITTSFMEKASRLMKEPIIFDGRNCFSLEDAQQFRVEYHSIGRPSVLNLDNK